MKISALFSRQRILTTLGVLVAALLCVRLGFWQLDRLAQRRAFNSQVRLVQSLPPARPPFSDDLVKQEYRRIQVQGTFDFQREFVVRNQFYNGQYGYHLVTPLRVNSGGTADSSDGAVLVDRGWIPAEGNSHKSDWAKYDTAKDAAVDGVVRTFESPPSWLPPTPTATGVAGTASDVAFQMFVEPAGAGSALPYALLPIYVQALPADSSAPPLAVTPILDLSEGPHLGYAIQWFGFAALLLIGYPVYVLRREGSRV